MGGQSFCAAFTTGPRAFAAAALSAPMLAVSTRGPAGLGGFAGHDRHERCRPVDGLGYGHGGPRSAPRCASKTTSWTSDRSRWLNAIQALITKKPELRLAGPTWGWLKAANESMARVVSRGYAEAIGTRVLVCGAGKDRDRALRRRRKRLPGACRAEPMPSSKTPSAEILVENDSIRARFWKAFDAFVAAGVN